MKRVQKPGIIFDQLRGRLGQTNTFHAFYTNNNKNLTECNIERYCKTKTEVKANKLVQLLCVFD